MVKVLGVVRCGTRSWVRGVWKELVGSLRDRSLAPLLCIGLGLVLVPLYREIPGGYSALSGHSLLISGSLLALVFRPKKIRLGKPIIWIPLVVIVVSYGVTALVVGGSSVLYFFYMVYMFLFYLACRSLGKRILVLLVPVLAIHIGVSLFHGFKYPGSEATGFTGNSNIMGCLLVVLLFMCRGKWRWLVIPGVVALFLTGSHWGILALLGVVIVQVLVKESRLGWKYPAVSFLIILAIVGPWTWSGFTGRLYQFDIFVTARESGRLEDLSPRWEEYKEVLNNIAIVGHGPESLIPGEKRNIDLTHCVPLMIMDTAGPIAGVAWVVAIVGAIWISPKWRYPLLGMFFMSLPCYWFWWLHSLGPYFWAFMGLASRGEE